MAASLLLCPVQLFAEGAKEEGPKLAESITLMASQNWIKDIDRELFARFKEESGIEVKVIVTPDGGYETLLGTTLSGGSNAIDIFMFGAGNAFISAGIQDIAVNLSDESWVDRYEPWAKEATSYNGNVYGFNTWGIDYEGILYNKSFFEENNLEVPGSWNEFVALCDRILELGKIPLYEGINGVWHTSGWIYAMTPAILAEKPDFVSWINETPDHKFASLASTRLGAEQFEEFFSARKDGKPKYFTNDGQAEDWFGSFPSLINRETIMMFTYSAYEKQVISKGSEDKWGMFPCPIAGSDAVVNNGGGICKFINKSSDNIEECKMLFNFLTREDIINTYYAQRDDFAAPAFQNVTAMTVANATVEAVKYSTELPPTMILRTMLYWSSDIYKYCQAVAAGTGTGMDILNNIDEYRATMFEAAEQ